MRERNKEIMCIVQNKNARRVYQRSLLTLLAAIVLFPQASSAQFTYTAIDNGAAIEITGYTGEGGEVTIPDSIDGLPVTQIGDNVFQYNSTMKKITIPGSVTHIGKSAFSFCTGLGEITIPEKVTTIGDFAFEYCSKLKTVTLPDSLTDIGSEAFSQCTGLVDMTISRNVVAIGMCAFWGCTSLTGITVDENNLNFLSRDGILFDKEQTVLLCYPAAKTGAYTISGSVTRIEAYSFSDCAGLSGISIPDSVLSIGEYAFYQCNALTEIAIPPHATIEKNPFLECAMLNQILVAEENPNYTSLDGVLFTKTRSVILCCPGGKSGIYAIPNTVTRIGDYAFAGCANLIEIVIPNDVTKIESSAFLGCVNLTRINLPATLTAIEDWVFHKCTSLTGIDLPQGIIRIGNFAFCRCENLTDLSIPDHVTSIGNSAFSSCFGLTTLVIPDRVTAIESWAFTGCKNLASVTLSASVTTIGDWAFAMCPSLTGVYFLGDAPTDFGDSVFHEDSENFSIYYQEGKSGWTTPTWNGYPAQPFTGPSSVTNWERY